MCVGNGRFNSRHSRESGESKPLNFGNLYLLKPLDSRFLGNDGGGPNPALAIPTHVENTLSAARTIAKSSLLPVILSGANNPILNAETLRFAQNDNLSDFAIVLVSGRAFRLLSEAGFLGLKDEQDFRLLLYAKLLILGISPSFPLSRG